MSGIHAQLPRVMMKWEELLVSVKQYYKRKKAHLRYHHIYDKKVVDQEREFFLYIQF